MSSPNKFTFFIANHGIFCCHGHWNPELLAMVTDVSYSARGSRDVHEEHTHSYVSYKKIQDVLY